MIEGPAGRLVSLKAEFARTLGGGGGGGAVHEVVPGPGFLGGGCGGADDTPMLNLFAASNPIYHSSRRTRIMGADCVAHEGDINEYWLDSIAHESSRAPFSPTWICSAYLLAREAVRMGYREIVDVGSGDGRIAYCGRILGAAARSIEIDGGLVKLQEAIAGRTGVDFAPVCADATRYDFAGAGLKNPAFFIGGLAQMGGDEMAASIIRQISPGRAPTGGAGFVLAGTRSMKYAGSESDAGWGEVIKESCLVKKKTVTLPTNWTFGEPDGTPYVFAGF